MTPLGHLKSEEVETMTDDSVITVTYDSRAEVNMCKDMYLMSETIFVLFAVPQDIMSNTVMWQCTNFKTWQHSLEYKYHNRQMPAQIPYKYCK